MSRFANIGRSIIHPNLTSIFSTYRDLAAVMPNVVLQVTADVKTTLREVGASELSSELEALLGAQILEISKPEHKIRHLVSQYFIP